MKRVLLLFLLFHLAWNLVLSWLSFGFPFVFVFSLNQTNKKPTIISNIYKFFEVNLMKTKNRIPKAKLNFYDSHLILLFVLFKLLFYLCCMSYGIINISILDQSQKQFMKYSKACYSVRLFRLQLLYPSWFPIPIVFFVHTLHIYTSYIYGVSNCRLAIWFWCLFWFSFEFDYFVSLCLSCSCQNAKFSMNTVFVPPPRIRADMCLRIKTQQAKWIPSVLFSRPCKWLNQWS